ncbi:MAG: lytic transglycosylase domain-containing protein [Minwuia sp.]|uniref:lytic transglycosylase domain-containing protein n=1 Tax=Minwuia sp. TaxID=2493630 RepID=UPI003A88EFF3
MPAIAADLPRVLSSADADRYAEIFELQQRAQWRRADRLIRTIDDRILMGHVLYQRYMHPRGGRTSYAKLHNWMKSYADHPGSARLHELAEKRRPESGWNELTRPKYIRLTYPKALSGQYEGEKHDRAEAPKLSGHDRTVLTQVKRNVLKDRMTVTEEMLAGGDGAKLSAHAMAEARAQLARGHLSGGRHDRALEQGDLAMKGKGGGKRLGAYYAGIALWAMDRWDDALLRFRTAAETPADRIGNLGGAIDYWHARAALAAGRYQEAMVALQKAASYPRDIYGLVAIAQLARLRPFEWEGPKLSDAVMKTLMGNAGVRRALALAEAGQVELADAELDRLARYTDSAGNALVIAVAVAIDAPATAYRMARVRQRSFGEQHDTALYPVPDWEVESDGRIGKALLLAVARRESRFDPDARSRVGARGVMQLMPSTAAYVAEKANLEPVKPALLHDPEISLKYGQAYLGYLADLVQPNGGLIQILAAYNAGPGNLASWSKRFGERTDPLLFIELMGSRETRAFVKDVLSAYWIYRHRLGLPTPSLRDVAAGRWPIYVPPENLSEEELALGSGSDAY